MRIRTFIGIAVLTGVATGSVSADQEALQKVRALYAAAAYEDALAVVAALPSESRLPQLDQYRTFCLIALGQTEQAQQAIETLLESDPSYSPDPAETSPRVIESFSELRLRAVPVVSKKLYLTAKAALERKQRTESVEGFDRLLRLINSVPTPDPALDDMKLMADGFLLLARALPEEPARNLSPTEPTSKPAAMSAGPNTPEVAPTTTAASRPVAVKQTMPRWDAPDPISRRAEFRGLLRIKVGADGKVHGAEMIRRAHPMYDGLLLAATQDWIYEPAKQDGKPIASEVLVEVHLRPQE
jgi:tetratricopeptide (TPR) repeat protein